MSLRDAEGALAPRVWLAIAGLGITQIVSWGSTYYLLTMLARPIIADLGLSPEVVASGMSILLALSAMLGPTIGRKMDMLGARPVMATGSVLAAAGLLCLSFAAGLASYLAAWTVLGMSASMILYPAAFTALTQIAPAQARQAITYLTLPGGLASTVFWPLSQTLLEVTDWRHICLIYAGLHLLVCLPVHLAVIPHGGVRVAAPAKVAQTGAGLPPEARRKAFVLFAAMLAFNAMLVTGVLNQFMTVMTGLGLSTDIAIVCGMLFGIAQVTSRIVEIVFGARSNPLSSGVAVNVGFPLAFACLALAPALPLAGIAFALLLGACNGILTIVRGALVLQLFGLSGYGEKLGKVIVAQGLMAAMAPMLITGALTAFGPGGTLACCLVIALSALVAMLMLFRHAARTMTPDRREAR